MQQERRTLSIRPTADLADDSDVGELLRRAIGRKLCTTAVYNRTAMTIAPHILYTRHDEPFVDGVVVEREGKPPREVKLGTFKLAGLTEVRLTASAFRPAAAFDPDNPLYAGTTIQAVRA